MVSGMKSLIINILAVFGAIFICLIIIAVHFVITDPYNLKPLLFPETQVIDNRILDERSENVDSEPVSTEPTSTSPALGAMSNDNLSDADQPKTESAIVEFNLTAEQRQALINLGIPETSIPTSVSYEQEQCFVSVLGEARVAEIKAGAVPGPIEFLRAKACI